MCCSVCVYCEVFSLIGVVFMVRCWLLFFGVSSMLFNSWLSRLLLLWFLCVLLMMIRLMLFSLRLVVCCRDWCSGVLLL